MNPTSAQPKINMTQAANYGESYANSVQVRVSVWDFFLVFGTAHQETPENVTIQNTHGIYLSSQQAKSFFNILGQNLAHHEQTFGPISLEPQGQIHRQAPVV